VACSATERVRQGSASRVFPMVRTDSIGSPAMPALRRQRVCFRLTLLVVLGGVASIVVCSLATSAFLVASAPAVLDRAESRSQDGLAEQKSSSRGKTQKAKKNSTVPVLQLGDGFPEDFEAETVQGPQWATCIVEAQEAGRVTFEGVTAARSVLEQWLVRGERDRVTSFRAWRRSLTSDARVRCTPKSAASTEDAFCLECISHTRSGAFPFTPLGHVEVTETGSVMTFSGLHECLASTAGAGFCKTGLVSVPK